MAGKKKATKKAASKSKAKAKAKPKAAKKAKKKVSPIPREYRTVTASLKQRNAAATIEFCKKAFGAKVLSKLSGPGGIIMHSQIMIGDSIIHVADAHPGTDAPGGNFLYVTHIDKTFAKAEKAGATVIMPPTDMFWGDRFAVVKDSEGNIWELASRFEIVKADELKKRSKAFAKEMAAANS